MSLNRQAIIADILWNDHLRMTETGHCARVDFLDRDEAFRICEELTIRTPERELIARVLTRGDERGAEMGASADNSLSRMHISIDQAIEVRNRKTIRLCLFVPSDLVDAAVSSLANSFAVVDGRDLLASVQARLEEELPPEALAIWRDVSVQVRQLKQIGAEDRLDFLQALKGLAQTNELHMAGLELWRVGLIVDAAPSFRQQLSKNRNTAQALSRPSTVGMRTNTRIRSLRLEDDSAAYLTIALGNKELFDVRTWSRALLEEAGPTFDQWQFQVNEQNTGAPSEVRILPFLTAEGAVERSCKLTQPDGPGGYLVAECGTGKKIVVRWKTVPASAKTARWRIEVLPNKVDPEEVPDLDLPSKEVPGARRSATISLDLELEDPPANTFIVRVTALDESHNPLRTPDDGEEEEGSTSAISNEFYLGKESDEPMPTTRKTTSSLPLGRLQWAVDSKESEIKETEALWVGGDEYFSVKLNERRVVNVRTSPLLVALGREILAAGKSSGSYELRLAELREATRKDLVERPLHIEHRELWDEFLSSRQRFLSSIGRSAKRDALEATEWTPSLANNAIQYGQAYVRLLERLSEVDASKAELASALSVDTIFVEVASSSGRWDQSLLVLPTHPMRSAWLASYSQLLLRWEKQVLEMPHKARKGSIDFRALAQLTPANCPPFGVDPANSSRYIFYDNLSLFHGVLFPDVTSDPHRRLTDLQVVFATNGAGNATQETYIRRLSDYIKRYLELHPYISAIEIAAINAGRAALVADALREVLSPQFNGVGNNNSTAPVKSVGLDFYATEPNASIESGSRTFTAITGFLPSNTGNSLSPSLRLALRRYDQLAEGLAHGTHLTLIADWSRAVVGESVVNEVDEELGSLSMYGLVARFVPLSITVGPYPRWEYGMYAGQMVKVQQHPAGVKFGTVLENLHVAHNRALASLLSASHGVRIVVGVSLDVETNEALKLIHKQSDWVVTLDRFFPLEVFDTPSVSARVTESLQYLLDYAPEYGEGISHHIMLTTDKRSEVENTLEQAMDELGFRSIEQSAKNLMQHLKTISGRLVLDAFDSTNRARAAIGMAMVASWLAREGRLQNALLVPVDPNPGYFSPISGGPSSGTARRCDMILFSFKKQFVEAVMIEVKWRQGSSAINALLAEMREQMAATQAVFSARYFNPQQIDSTVQRSMLANLLRFYCRRATRYGLLDHGSSKSMMQEIGRLERTRIELRTSLEGFIARLNDEPLQIDVAPGFKFHVLTPASFEEQADLIA